MGSNKNEPQDITVFLTVLPLQLKLVMRTNISVNHYHLFTLCVFDYSCTHIHRVDTVHVIYVCLSKNSHEDTLSLTQRCTDAQIHTSSQSSHVYMHNAQMIVF